MSGKIGEPAEVPSRPRNWDRESTCEEFAEEYEDVPEHLKYWVEVETERMHDYVGFWKNEIQTPEQEGVRFLAIHRHGGVRGWQDFVLDESEDPEVVEAILETKAQMVLLEYYEDELEDESCGFV